MMGKSLRMNKIICTFLLCAAALTASAQKTFKYAAKVGPVDTPGFYSIMLTPQLVAKSKTDLSDIRLMDDSGHFVPYVLFQGPEVVENSTVFTPFPVLNVKSAHDTGTTFVVENRSQTPVYKLWVGLKNTAVKRTVDLYGSDDLKKWFAIAEDMPLERSESNDDSQYFVTLTFPASNYRYLKLQVNDKNRAPVKFISAGSFLFYAGEVSYFPIKGSSFSKRDSGKVSIFTIKLDDNYAVDKIELQIKAPRFYHRDVSVYKVDGGYRELLNTGTISSQGDVSLKFYTKTRRIELWVMNEDNSPLNIQNISVYQAERPMMAYLEAGRTYKIFTGDSSARKPVYDLRYFTDSARKHMLHIAPGGLSRNPLYAEPLPLKQKNRNQTVVIWSAIAVALSLLLVLTWRMLAEVKKRDIA